MLLIPVPLLAVRLPMLGGGAMLKELEDVGLGGGMLNEEYRLLCGWLGGGGGAIEKFWRLLGVFDIVEDAPHGLEDTTEELDALLQSMPPLAD